jgi:hypothetical protein
MDLTHKILAGTVVVLLIGGVIGFRSWLGEQWKSQSNEAGPCLFGASYC